MGGLTALFSGVGFRLDDTKTLKGSFKQSWKTNTFSATCGGVQLKCENENFPETGSLLRMMTSPTSDKFLGLTLD